YFHPSWYRRLDLEIEPICSAIRHFKPVCQPTIGLSFTCRSVSIPSHMLLCSSWFWSSPLYAGNFFGEAPRFSQISFFWLGVGFMLIETKKHHGNGPHIWKYMAGYRHRNHWHPCHGFFRELCSVSAEDNPPLLPLRFPLGRTGDWMGSCKLRWI